MNGIRERINRIRVQYSINSYFYSVHSDFHSDFHSDSINSYKNSINSVQYDLR
jgi:hypothetical protein